MEESVGGLKSSLSKVYKYSNLTPNGRWRLDYTSKFVGTVLKTLTSRLYGDFFVARDFLSLEVISLCMQYSMQV